MVFRGMQCVLLIAVANVLIRKHSPQGSIYYTVHSTHANIHDNDYHIEHVKYTEL